MELIDWDNYALIEAEDFTKADLESTIEDVRETLDYLRETWPGIPEQAVELLTELTELYEEMEDD